MCGIAGAWSNRVKFHLGTLNNCLNHRGPDSQGHYKVGNVFLFHTRLSILDTSDAGSQPFHYKNLSLVFNGEIYNFIEIRKKLIDHGYSFETASDTEVLIKAFHYWGIESVNYFIGMFAFVIYDVITEELFLFRDRVGVKPLFYAQTVDGFFFGSEIKVFYEFPLHKTIDLNSVSDYFRFGYVSEEHTIFNEIKKVPPGHFLCYKNGNLKISQYWALADKLNKNDGNTEKQSLKLIEETLVSAINYRMVSDVPIGIFLSGGIDSSLVAAVLQRHYGSINTFTIGFKEQEYNEANYARKIASHLKTTHIEKILGIEEGKKSLLNFYEIFDEPFADSSGIPTSLVAALAKENGVKVVISADGGDELFGGYNRYYQYSSLYNKLKRMPLPVREAVAKCLEHIIPDFFRANCYAGNIEHKIYKVEEVLRNQSVKEYYEGMLTNQAKGEINNLFKNPLHERSNKDWKFNYLGAEEQMMLWDFHHYLPNDLLVKVDRATMFNNVEGREPFLDHRLVELAYSIPLNMKIRDGESKYALRKILGNYLPLNYIDRPKKGFSIPLFDWFKKEFHILFESFLSKEMITAVGFLNLAEVEKEKRKYYYNKARGNAHNIEKMWRLLSFMMWWNRWYK